MNTKERILYNSLDLFSKNCYDAVSMRTIAKYCGIKGSSLYNHFSSKKEILNSVIDMYSEMISKKFYTLSNSYLKESSLGSGNAFYKYFLNSLLCIYSYILIDEYSLKLRRLLFFEKSQNKKACHMYERLYITNILDYTNNIISKINVNSKIKNEKQFFSMQLCAPLFLLLLKLDDISDNDIEILKLHLIKFEKIYLEGV